MWKLWHTKWVCFAWVWVWLPECECGRPWWLWQCRVLYRLPIFLWLECSGESVFLDIEIFLRVARPGFEVPLALPRWTVSSLLLGPIILSRDVSSHQQVATHHLIPHPPPPASIANATIVMPPSPPRHQDGWSIGRHTFHGHNRSANTISRISMHWGHIAFFYLTRVRIQLVLHWKHLGWRAVKFQVLL